MGTSSDERLRDEDDVVSPQEDRERRMSEAGGKKGKSKRRERTEGKSSEKAD